MHDAGGVRERDGLDDALEDREARGGLGHRREALFERAAVDEFHHVERAAIHERAGVVHGHDARMLEAREDLRFQGQARVQSLDRRVGRRGVRHFDGDIAVEQCVVGGIHAAHPAAREQAQVLVAVAGKLGPHRGLAQPRDRLVVDECHESISAPKSARASSRYSASVAEMARNSSRAASRNRRRA